MPQGCVLRLVLFHVSDNGTGKGSERHLQAAHTRVSRAAVFLQGRDSTHTDLGRPEEWARVTLTSFSKDKCQGNHQYQN